MIVVVEQWLRKKTEHWVKEKREKRICYKQHNLTQPILLIKEYFSQPFVDLLAGTIVRPLLLSRPSSTISFSQMPTAELGCCCSLNDDLKSQTWIILVPPFPRRRLRPRWCPPCRGARPPCRLPGNPPGWPPSRASPWRRSFGPSTRRSRRSTLSPSYTSAWRRLWQCAAVRAPWRPGRSSDRPRPPKRLCFTEKARFTSPVSFEMKRKTKIAKTEKEKEKEKEKMRWREI